MEQQKNAAGQPTEHERDGISIDLLDTLISDTVWTDEGYQLVIYKHDLLSDGDSVDVWVNGKLTASDRLNDGGYMASHTSLQWTSKHVICFRMGCGSPCWIDRYVFIDGSRKAKEVFQPVWSGADTVNSVVFYADTMNPCCGLVAENLSNGKCIHAVLDTTRSAYFIAGIDSIWAQNEVLSVRRNDLDGKVENVDVSAIF